MNILANTNAVKFLSVLSLVLSINISQNASANEHESACKDYVQNKIAWDPNSAYETAQKWEQVNLENLCKGTNTPKAPGECFHKVMTGHVKWGTSDKWEWKNAITLCAGTDNADERISCFNGRVNAGEKWDTAIFQCQSNRNHNNKILE
jgi:hypothetical protein